MGRLRPALLLFFSALAASASVERGGGSVSAGFDAPPPATDGGGEWAWVGGGGGADGAEETGFGAGSGGWAAEQGVGREQNGHTGDASGFAGAGSTARPAAEVAGQAVTVVVDTSKPLGLQLSGDLAVVSVAPEAPPSLARLIRPGDRLVAVDGRVLQPSGTQYPLARLRSWLHAPKPRWKQLRFLLAHGASLASRTPDPGPEEGRVVVSLPRGVPHGMILAPATAPPEVVAFAPAVLLTARQRHALHAQLRASPQLDAHLVSTWLAAAEVLCAAVLIGGEQLDYAQRSGNASRAMPFPGPRGTAQDPVAPPHAPAFGLARLGAFALPAARRRPLAWRSRVLPHALRVHALLAGDAAGAADACALLRRRVGVEKEEEGEGGNGSPPPEPRGADAKPSCRVCNRDAVPTAPPVLLSGAVRPGDELVEVAGTDVRGMDGRQALALLLAQSHNATAGQCRAGMAEARSAAAWASTTAGQGGAEAAPTPAPEEKAWRYCSAADPSERPAMRLVFRRALGGGGRGARHGSGAEPAVLPPRLAAASAASAFGFRPSALLAAAAALRPLRASYAHRRRLLAALTPRLPAAGHRSHPAADAVDSAPLHADAPVPAAAAPGPALGLLHLFSDEYAVNVTMPAVHARGGGTLPPCSTLPLAVADPTSGCPTGTDSRGAGRHTLWPRQHPGGRALPPSAAPLPTVEATVVLARRSGCSLADKALAAREAGAAALVVAFPGPRLELPVAAAPGQLPVLAVPDSALAAVVAYHDGVMRDAAEGVEVAPAWGGDGDGWRPGRTRRARLAYALQCLRLARHPVLGVVPRGRERDRLRRCATEGGGRHTDVWMVRGWATAPESLPRDSPRGWWRTACVLWRHLGPAVGTAVADAAAAETDEEAERELARRFPLRAPRLYARWLPAPEASRGLEGGDDLLQTGVKAVERLRRDHAQSAGRCAPLGTRMIQSLAAV